MSDRIAETRVSFPAGVVTQSARVLGVEPLPDGDLAMICDRSPFHPRSHRWPDQPGDQGLWQGEGRSGEVADTLTGCLDPDGTLQVDTAIRAHRGEPGHRFVVVHRIAGPPPTVGEVVDLRVDRVRRAALSRAHSACHLASLALNEALEPFWRKHPGPRDGAGRIDFDRLAIQSSEIREDRSIDRYRIGKSLKKKGFQASEAVTAWPDVARQINQRVQSFIARDATVDIECEDERLTASRTWICDLNPPEPVRIFCGGTHVHRLGQLGQVRVTLVDEGDAVRMETRVEPPESTLID